MYKDRVIQMFMKMLIIVKTVLMSSEENWSVNDGISN